MNIDRKLLEILLLLRVIDILDPLLGAEQCAYRAYRSTTEIVWVHRWLSAIAQRFKIRFQSLGIDLSKAFDCVVRSILYEELEEILDEDCLRILRVLLSDTTLQVKIGDLRSEPFQTMIGVPQGGSLSPIFFILYLHLTMKGFEDQVLARPTDGYYTQPTYADDINFVRACPAEDEEAGGDDEDGPPAGPYRHPDLQAIIQQIPDHMAARNLQVNLGKTTYTMIDNHDTRNLNSKMVGSMVGEVADMKQRISHAAAAFRAHSRFFRSSSHIKLAMRVRIYNACILPCLTYNLGCQGLSKAQLKPFDVAQRGHLRIITRQFHRPGFSNIRNDRLYALTNTVPISSLAIKCRWQFLGHVLRRPADNPAYLIMRFHFECFETHDRRTGGMLRCNLPFLLNQDMSFLPRTIRVPNRRRGRQDEQNLAGITYTEYRPSLRNVNDLDRLRAIAQDRSAWQEMTKLIYDGRTAPPDQVLSQKRRSEYQLHDIPKRRRRAP
jgi:hypothetical protein